MNSAPLHREPLHCQLAKRLRAEIMAKCKPGDRLDAEAKLAARFRVSVRTIREALSALAQEGLLERRHGSGTYVADGRPPQHIGLWYGFDPQYPRSNYAQCMLGQLHSYLRQQGQQVKTYSVCVASDDFSGDAAHKELLEDLTEHRVSAIGIVQGTFSSQALKLTKDTGVPVVWNDAVPSVQYAAGADGPGMITDGTRYLIERGCRKIAMMLWMGREPTPSVRTIIDLFRQTLTAHGLEFRREWVRGDLHPTLTGAGYDEFREIWTYSADKPDGLLVTDDVLFQDVVTAILELGIRVPDQLRVVAHANEGMVTCPFFPAARIVFDPAEQAHAMGELLVKLARKQPIENPQVNVSFRWAEGPVADQSPSLAAGVGKLMS
jgi:DNA-binding LacI/PurR family transcriptional regulator